MSVKYRNQNGQETIIAGLTPGGDIEAGAVMTRSGQISIEPLAIGEYKVVTVTFDDPMPDNIYIINIDCTSGRLNIATFNKTVNGFSLVYLNSSTLAQSEGDSIVWTATKTYTVQHAAQNAEDIATLKAAVPVSASASNQLTTKSYVDNADSALDSRLDDIEDVIPTTASVTNQLATKSEVSTKQDTLTFDSTPTVGSSNPVTSNGIKVVTDNLNNHFYNIEITGTDNVTDDIKTLLNLIFTNKTTNGGYSGDFIRLGKAAGNYNVAVYRDPQWLYVVGTCISGADTYSVHRQQSATDSSVLYWYIQKLVTGTPIIEPRNTVPYVNSTLFGDENPVFTGSLQYAQTGKVIQLYGVNFTVRTKPTSGTYASEISCHDTPFAIIPTLEYGDLLYGSVVATGVGRGAKAADETRDSIALAVMQDTTNGVYISSGWGLDWNTRYMLSGTILVR